MLQAQLGSGGGAGEMVVSQGRCEKGPRRDLEVASSLGRDGLGTLLARGVLGKTRNPCLPKEK